MFILLLQFFLWTSIGQTFVAQRATSYLENKLQTVVSIEKVDISFFKFYRFENLYIEDHQKDTLAFIKTIEIGINNFHFKNDTLKLDFGMIHIVDPFYNLYQFEDDVITNLSFVLEPLKSSDTTSSNLNVLVTAQNFVIEEGRFVWDNYNFDTTGFGINWDHINLSNLDMNVSYFEMVNDTFMGHINHLSGYEISGFTLNEFTGEATFNSVVTSVENLHVETPNSNIYTDLDYSYDSIGSYVNFNREVYMQYEIDTSRVSLKDISYFAPVLEGLDEVIMVYGKERGSVSDMNFSKLYLKHGKETVIDGRVFITGLPDLENTSFNCKLKKVSTNYQDLRTLKTYPFTDNKFISVPPFIENTGRVSFKGSFEGFYNNFVTYGTFKSKNGNVTTDLQVATGRDGIIRYNGSIKTSDFNLAEITGNSKLFNKTSFDVQVKGENLSFKTIDISVKGKASRFDFLGYSYTDVSVNASLADQTFSGLVNVIDTNINFAFDGSIAMKEKVPTYSFDATIEHLRPKQLHLLDRDTTATLSTKVHFKFKGNSLDNIHGHASLEDFYFSELGEEVKLNSVNLIALTEGKNKTLSIISDNIELEILGEYYFEEAMQSLNYMTYKWLPSIYGKVQDKPKSTQKFELTLRAHNFSGFSKIFIPQVTFNKEFNMNISFNSETERLNIVTNSPEMTFVNHQVDDFFLNANITPDTFELQSSSGKLLFTDSSYIENIGIKSIASKDLVQSEIDWNNKTAEDDNSGKILFDLKFLDPENFDIVFYDSWVEINDTVWTIRDSSQIIKQGKNYAFDNVLLVQNNQDFSLNGFISEDPNKQLVIDVDSFNLNNLNPIIGKYNIETFGVMDGTSVLQDVYGQINLYSKLEFHELIFNDQKIGTGYINSEWKDESEKFELNVGFFNDTLKTINLTGDYYPNQKKEQLDIGVTLNRFPVSVLEPFFKNVANNLNGYASGNGKINGTMKKILFNGDFKVYDVSAHIDYLKETLYLNDQKLFIRPNLIGADVITVKDSRGRKAELNFSMFHDNFKNMNFDLSVTSIDVFRVFNTKKTDNDYFYGKVYLNPGSTLDLSSDYDGNLSIEANVKSGPGTRVFLPFFDPNEVAKREYIYFKPLESDTVKKPIQEFVNAKNDEFNLNLNMTAELTKNASLELILDEFNADKIHASGTGTINMELNETGDFKMYGNYEIYEGYYLFTFSKIISKKFSIKSGSHLTWNGDPYKGIADITAAYKVRTPLIDLGDIVTGVYDSTELSKRIAVEIVLSMKNNYMNPDLSFSFKLPAKYAEISALLNNLDEGQKNIQIFSLLILNKFMPIAGGMDSEAGLIATNSTEVLSNQLSNWLSKLSNDFDVGFRYNPDSEISGNNEVELALSTQIFNDRVLIETNVGVTSATTGNATTPSQSSTFVGEFTISYKINEKGNIVGKVFNRSNELNPVYQNTSPYTQGVGISYTEPFNTWSNLGCVFSNHFRKKENKRDCVQEHYNNQKENEEENIAAINKRVAKSRIKQKKKEEKRKKREDKAKRKRRTKTVKAS